MQHINGSANRNEEQQSLLDNNAPGVRQTVSHWTQEPPAKEFSNGRVITRVWANPNHWGDITWRVDQIRIRYGSSSKTTVAKSMHVEDLQDAMRGFYQAKRWIRKTERSRRWGFLVWKRW